MAAEALGLKLYPMSRSGHDAYDAQGDVQIKMTARDSIAMYAECVRLVVLRVISAEEAEIVYDGPGAPAWACAGPVQKNGQRVVSLTKLRRLNMAAQEQVHHELLHEAVPSASRFAVVANPPNPVPENRRELEVASKTVGVILSIIPVNGPDDFDSALARAKQDRVGGILATADPVTFLYRKRLVDTALKHQLPGLYWTREYVEDGGLMTYSANRAELLRRAATYVDKIFQGAKPADLPVEQPTKFELVINLKTAKALGLTIPPSLLLRADEVIQ